MRGRPGCPTGQKKHSVEATVGRAPFFYKERLGTGSPPHPPQCAHWGTFPPRGRLWAVLPFPSAKPPLPARPAGGRAVTGVGQMGRRPGKKRRRPPQGPPNQKRWVQGGRISSSLVFFPPAFFQRKPGSRPEPGGKPRRRAHPAPVQKAPQTGLPPGAGRATTWQVWTCAGPNLDHLPIQRSPG